MFRHGTGSAGEQPPEHNQWESTELLTWEPAANLRGGNLAQDMRIAPYWSDLPADLIDKYTKGLSPKKPNDDNDDADDVPNEPIWRAIEHITIITIPSSAKRAERGSTSRCVSERVTVI